MASSAEKSTSNGLRSPIFAGGSVVADRLTREGLSVCMLERGLPHPPGTFPRTPSEIKTSFWDPSQKLYGMFDVWSFSGLAALVSSGLGGN